MGKRQYKTTKNPRGTRDFNSYDVQIREEIFSTLKDIFRKYGGQPIDTPVIECLDTVKNIYGEEFNKLVYKLEDDKLEDKNDGINKKEELLLRYDLTVPFARFVANNGLKSFKRYQLGKVYRKDKPNIKNGRFREFYQCDFDIIGEQTGQMIQEAEILNLLVDVLDSILDKNSYKIKLNSRKILFSICKKCGVYNFNNVCNTIDKLDKLDKEHYSEFINKELLEKGENINTINNIINFILNTTNNYNSYEMLKILINNDYIDKDISNEFNILFKYLEGCNIMDNIIFDPTIARGLDYYTGLIYEVVYDNEDIISTTIAAGGRYDNLIGKLTKKNVPAIGVSFGIERIVTILEKTNKLKLEDDNPKVYVATIGKNMICERIKLCQELRRFGIYSDMSYANNPKMPRQLHYVFDNKIPFMIVLGEDELKNGIVTLKDIEKNEQSIMKKKDAIQILLKN